MGTVLFAWEQGAGVGHMLQALPLAEGLAAAGHRVYVALRSLTRGAAAVFGQAGVSFLPAPSKIQGPACFARTDGFAHVLANVGWGDELELFALTCAWRNLMLLTRPDLVVFDHAPTALLASRCLPGVRRALLGAGFFCPPDAATLPAFDGPSEPTRARLEKDEGRILDRANRLLGRWGLPPLERLARLYAEVDETFLVTFPELDHYGRRDGARYWGPVNGTGGAAPRWPPAPGRGGRGAGGADGKRVFAYLKHYPAVTAVLEALARRDGATLVCLEGADRATRERYESPTLRFVDERLDMAWVGRECDAAVLNANHGTLCDLLLAGRPTLQVPITMEQSVLARAACRTGAAERVSSKCSNAGEVAARLDALLADDAYARAAARFARAHADFNPGRQRRQMLERAEELLASRPAHRAALV